MTGSDRAARYGRFLPAPTQIVGELPSISEVALRVRLALHLDWGRAH